MHVTAPPPLLIDTTSLLRVCLDRFEPWIISSERVGVRDNHHRSVIESLIIFERILLDGPSIERNSDRLQWLADVDDDIEILNIASADESALYRSVEVFAQQVHPTGDTFGFMHMHMPAELGLEIQRSASYQDRAFRPSTRWQDLQDVMESEDLWRLQKTLEQAFISNGSTVPFSGAAFVAIVRSLYYLCLQESTRSSLLLDPYKGLETLEGNDIRGHARCILDLFDHEVAEAFRERKRRWLGGLSRSLRLPLLEEYIWNEAKRRGWSIGRVILWMRQSPEVRLFRSGLNQLQDALDSNDVTQLDAIFADLDAAAATWSKQLGISYRKRGNVSVSVSLPFVSATKSLPLPHMSRRSTSDKLLVFVSKLLSAS